MSQGPQRECNQAASGNDQRYCSIGSELAHRTGELGGAIDRSMQHRSLSSDVYIFNYRIDAELHVKFVVVSRRQSLASGRHVFGWRQTVGSAEAICFDGAGNGVTREHPAARACRAPLRRSRESERARESDAKLAVAPSWPALGGLREATLRRSAARQAALPAARTPCPGPAYSALCNPRVS